MPINPTTLAAGATAVGAAGDLFGGGGSTKPALPSDLRGMRQNNIDLLNYLLFGAGVNPGGTTAGNTGRKRGAPWTSGIDLGRSGGFGGDPTARLESFFGTLGVPQSDLQRQASGGISEFLKTNPEAKAYDALNQILGANPGQGIMDALQPQFQRNLSAANASGPRFGTANSIAKTRAVDDYNLLSQQALAQGINQQIQASQVLNQLGDSAFNRLTGAYGVGKDLAGQADIATQRRLQLLLQLLGTSQSASLGVGTTQQPNFLSTLGNSGMDLATFLAAMQKNGGGGGNDKVAAALGGLG